MFMADEEFAYARIIRCGSATRAASVGPSELIISPRYAGSPSASTACERGLVYCPATRATLTTGRLAPYVSTTAICSSVRALDNRWDSVLSANVSAQSPPCNRNARPSQTSASLARSPPPSYGAPTDGPGVSTLQPCPPTARPGHGGVGARGSDRQWSRPNASASA